MRKGLLASLALVVGNTAAQAQYFPAPRPYYPVPNGAPVWVAQPAPAYFYPNAPRQAYPAGNPNYLPQGYFPALGMRPVPVVVQDAPSTPVPAEPVPTDAVETLAPPVNATPFSTRAGTGYGPAKYFDVLPPAATEAPK